MDIKVKEGKNLENILNDIEKEENISLESICYKKETKKGGLFKGEVTTVKYITIEEAKTYIKEILEEILNNMGLNPKFEQKIRDNQIYIQMYSNNNNILIGKNGQTLEAIKNVVKQIAYNKTGFYIPIILDVENYNDKKVRHLERLAKNIAREVKETKIEVKLDNMNSYERKVVHNTLTENKYVYTESVGEEPNRYIIIKPKEEK